MGCCSSNYIVSYCTQEWFDGAGGHEILIFNDYTGKEDEIPFATLITLFDPFPSSVQVKGGFTQNSSKFLIFTSNVHPKVGNVVV